MSLRFPLPRFPIGPRPGPEQAAPAAPPSTPSADPARIPLEADTIAGLSERQGGALVQNPPWMQRIKSLLVRRGSAGSLATGDFQRDADAIEQCLKTANAWSVLGRCTTEKDLQDVKNMCQQVNPARWREIYVQFFDAVQAARGVRPVELKARDENLPDDWFHEPFYYTYVQYFGSDSRDSQATFDHLIRQLDYLENAGIKNLFLLPHYESPMGDGGYDVSDFQPRTDLGGRVGYARFMKVANERGFRVCTDLPLNHTSVKHRWFQAALAGDEEKLSYYLRCEDSERIGVEDRNGDLVARYREPDGTITERVLIFPDVDREHGKRFTLRDGREVKIYQEFYPFQLDLDLTQPAVLKEVFQLLGEELNQGVLGKRTDAIAHWIKKPGTTADGLDETHALHALLKSFSRHVSPKMIILPEAVRSMDELKKYCGVDTQIAGREATSEGDALFNFQMQGALREMLYLETTTPFWENVFKIPELPANARMLNLLEHHDETYLGMISDRNRQRLAEYIEKNGGVVYKNGMSAGGRFADNLGNDPARIATAIFALYMAPGTPVMYYGTELGARSRPEHALEAQKHQQEIFRELGMDIPWEKVFDPRELQRGSIAADEFKAGESTEPFRMFARLNRLRAERKSLQSNLLTPVDNGHDSVLSLVKFTRDGSDAPILALANLAGEPRSLRLPRVQLEDKLGIPPGAQFSLVELGHEGEAFSMHHEADGTVRIELAPYQSLLLERRFQA